MAGKEYTRQIADALIEAGATVDFERFASNMGDENYRKQIADALIEAGATVNFESFNQKLLDEFNQGVQQKQETINKSLNLAESLSKSSQNSSSIDLQSEADNRIKQEKAQGIGEVTIPYVRQGWEERPFTKEMADNAWYNRMTRDNEAMLGRLEKLEAETQPKKEEPKGTVKGKGFSKEITKSFSDIQSKMYGEVVPKHIVENLDRYSPEDIAMLPKEMQMAVAGYYLQNRAEIERYNKQQERQVGNSQGYYKPTYKQFDNTDRVEEMVEIWRNGTIPDAKLNIDELSNQYNSLKRGAKTIPTAEGLKTEATFTTQDGVKYEGENAKMIDSAIKLNIEAQKIIDSPSSYDDSFGVANFFRGAGSQVEAKSMYLPFEKIARELQIGHIAKKMNSGQELTEPEDMLLRAYLTFCKANESRIYDMSLGYKAGQGTVDSLQFMLEMAIAGGITGAASKGAGNILTEAGKNWLRKSIKQGTSKAIGKGLFSAGRVLQGTTKAGVLMNGTTATVGAYVDAALMPSTWLGISEGYKEDMLNGDGKYTFGEGFSRYTDAAIENITERVGGIIDPYMLKIGKTISKPMTKALSNTKLGRRLKSAKTSILNSKGYAFMSKIYDFSDSYLKPFADLMQDPFSELGEEYIGGLINYGRSYAESNRSEELRQEFEHMITTEGFVETFAMTAPLSIFMGSANAVKVGNNIKNYSNAKKVFLNRLNTLGFTQDQARDILVYLDSFDNTENKKAANTYVGKMLYDVINQSDNYSTAEEKKKAIKDIQSVLSHYANASSAYSQDIKDLSENYKKLDEAKKKEVDEFLKNYTSEFIKNKQQQAVEVAIEDSKTQTEEELAEIVDEEKALAETENLLPKNTPESSANVINGQIEEGTDYVILGKTNSGELIKVVRKGMTKKDKDTGLLVIGYNVGSIFIGNKRTPITKEQRLEFNRTIRNSNGWIGKNGKYVNIFAEREKELKEAEIKQQLLQQSNDASAQEGQELLMQTEAQEQALFDDLSNSGVAQEEKPAVHPYGKQFIADKNGVKQITDENGEPFKFENKLQANSIARNLNENYEGTYSFVVKSHNLDSVPYFTIEGTPAKQGEVATEEAKTKTKEVEPKEEKAEATLENNAEIVETPKGPQMIVYYKGEPYEVVSEVKEDGSIVVPEDNLIRIKELEGDAIKSVRPSNVFANEKAEPIKTYPPVEKKASKHKPKDYQDTDVDIDDISDAIISKYKDKSARWVELEYAEQQKRLSTAKGGDILDIENNLERLVEVALAIEDKTGVRANLDAVENQPAEPKKVEEPKVVEVSPTNSVEEIGPETQEDIEDESIITDTTIDDMQDVEDKEEIETETNTEVEQHQQNLNDVESENTTFDDKNKIDSTLQEEQSDITTESTSEGEQLSDNTDDDASNERPIEEVIQKINDGDFLDYEDLEAIHNTLKTDVIEFPEGAFNTFMEQDRSIVGLYKLILTSLDKEIKESESFYTSRNNTARLEELNAYKNQIQPLVSALESAVGNEAREQLENKVVVKIGLDESEYIDVEEGKTNKSVDIDSLEIIDFFKSSKKKKLDDGQIDRYNYAVGKDAEGNLYLVKGEEAIKVTKDILAFLSGQEEWIPSTDWEKVTDTDGNAYIVKGSGKGRVSSVPLGHSKVGLKGGYNYKKESGEQYAKSYEEIQKEENQIAANRYLKENEITDIDSLTEEQKQEIIFGYADKYIWGDEVVENNNSNDDKKISEWVNDIKIHNGVISELASILGTTTEVEAKITQKKPNKRDFVKSLLKQGKTAKEGGNALEQLSLSLNGQKRLKKQTPAENEQEEMVESTYPEHISELIELVKGKKATDKITPLDYKKLRDKLKIFDIFSTAHYDRFERFFNGKNTWGGLRDWLNKYYDQFTNEYAMEYGADDEILVNNKPVLEALYETIPAKEDGSTRYELENEWMQDELNNLRDLLEYVLPANSRVTIVSPREIERMVEDMTDVIVTAENVKVLEKWIRGVNINLLSKEEWARKFNNDSRGAFSISTGKAFIREGAPITTIMHEVGWHATFQWAKEYDQVLYNKMIGFVATAPNHLVSKIERKYAKLAKNNPEVIIDEIGAELFAKTYRKQLNRVLKDKKSMTWWSKLLDVFNQVFDKAKSFIFKKADFDLKNIEGMNAVSAMEYIADAMIRGEHLGKPYKKHKEETNKANKYGRPSNTKVPVQGRKSSKHFQRGQQQYRYDIEGFEENFASANNKNKTIDSEIRFELTGRTRNDIEGWLELRDDLTTGEKQSVIDYLNTLPQSDNKVQRLAGWWFAKGTIRLPEDIEIVRQAVKTAEKKKIDLMSNTIRNYPKEEFVSPQAFLDANADAIKEKPINPDTVPTLSDKRTYEYGITTYLVDESQESRENMRKIINTHYGKDASPWCLLAGDTDGNGTLRKGTESYWYERYNAYPKRVAFRNGKLLAFCANSSERIAWWDRQDKAHEGVPFFIKVPNDDLGRRQLALLDENDGSIKTSRMFMGEQNKEGVYKEWDESGNLALVETYNKDGKIEKTEEIKENAIIIKSEYDGNWWRTPNKTIIQNKSGKILYESSNGDESIYTGSTFYSIRQKDDSVKKYNYDGVLIEEKYKEGNEKIRKEYNEYGLFYKERTIDGLSDDNHLRITEQYFKDGSVAKVEAQYGRDVIETKYYFPNGKIQRYQKRNSATKRSIEIVFNIKGEAIYIYDAYYNGGDFKSRHIGLHDGKFIEGFVSLPMYKRYVSWDKTYTFDEIPYNERDYDVKIYNQKGYVSKEEIKDIIEEIDGTDKFVYAPISNIKISRVRGAIYIVYDYNGNTIRHFIYKNSNGNIFIKENIGHTPIEDFFGDDFDTINKIKSILSDDLDYGTYNISDTSQRVNEIYRKANIDNSEVFDALDSTVENDLQIEDHIRFELTESDEIYGVLHSELGNVLAVNKQMPLRDIIYYVTNYSDRADEFKQYLEISHPEEAIKNEAQILRHTILDWFSEDISSYTDEEILNMTLADFLDKAKFPTSPEEVTEHLDRREEIMAKQDALLGSYENYGNQNAFSRWFDNYVTEMADDGLPIQRLLEGLNGWRKKKGLPPLTSEFDVVNQRNLVKSRAKGIIEVYENRGEYKALMDISAKLSKLLDKSSELSDDRLFIDLQRLDDDTNRGQAILEYYLLAKDNIERGEKARGREAFGEAFKYDGEDMTFEQYVELIESILGEDNITELWEKVRAATKFGLDYLHDHQVIGDSEYQEYLQRQYYVPERGFDDIYEEDERGHNSRGKNKKLNPKATIQARGGKTLATTPLASIKDIAYDSVVKALENDYRLSMYALINDEQNKEFFEEGFSFKGRTGKTNKQIEQPYATTYAVYMERETDEDGNFVVDEDGNFKWKLVNTKDEAKESEDKETMEKIQDSIDYISTLKKDLETTKKKIDRELRKKKKDQAEVDRLDAELKEIKEALKEEKRYVSELRKQIHYSNRAINISDKAADVVYVRVNGKPIAMQFADQRIADAMNGVRADIKRLERLIKANRWISNANTSYDPAFGPANFLRDMQQVAFVGGARYGAMFAARFSANIGAKVWSMTEIAKYLYGNKTSAKFEEFIKSGAMTGYIYSSNIDEYRKDVEQTIKEINKIVNGGKCKDDALTTLRLPSELSEIYVRYVAYQTAREMGYNEFNSAVIAKNAGVNFDKAGYGSNEGLKGVLYWIMQHQSFGKATLRGIMSMVEVMAVNKDSKAKARLFGSMMTFTALSVLGAFIKDMLSSEDDEQDEWRRLKDENILASTSDYDKRRSFVSFRDRQWNEILDSILPKTAPVSQNLIPLWGLGQNIYKWIKNSIVRENIGKSDYRKLLYQHSDENFFNHVINGRKEDGTPLYTEEEIKEIAKDYFTKPNTQIISDLLFDFSLDVIANWAPATSSVSEVGMNAIEYAKEQKDGDVYIKKSFISIAPTVFKSPMEALMNVDYFGNNIYYNNKYSGRKSNFSDFYAVKDIFENKEGLKAETKYGENGIESVDGFDEPAISQLLHITKQFTPRYVDALAEYTDRKLGEKFYGYLTEEEKNAGAPEYGILSKEDLLREYKNVEKEIMADKDLSDFDKENAINNIRTNIDYLERPEYYRRQDRVIAKQISEIASAAKDRMKDLKEKYAEAELSNDSDRIAELQSEIDQVNHILYSEESAKKLYEAIQKTNLDNLRMKLYPTEDYRKISDQELAERGLTADKYYEIINARKRAMLISKDIVLSGRRLNLVNYEGD